MVREPAVAGMFYPSSANKLERDIQQMLAEAKIDELFGNTAGIVSPHAGYIYSGKTAAYGYNVIANKIIKTAVIISPSHREYFPGISVYSGDAYKTPLGTVPLNKKKIEKLTEEKKYIFEGINGHRAEHAVEVQIPFLQVLFNDLEIVPVVMGDQKPVLIDYLAEQLVNIIDDETVIVASSDLSHFYSKKKADELDSLIERRINEFDYDGLQSDLELKKCEACGGGPIVAMMKTADLINKKKSKVIARSDSGDVSGDNSEVVGYLSAVVYES